MSQADDSCVTHANSAEDVNWVTRALEDLARSSTDLRQSCAAISCERLHQMSFPQRNEVREHAHRLEVAAACLKQRMMQVALDEITDGV